MRTGEKICWAVAVLGVPALIATHSVAKRLQYEEPVKAASEQITFIRLENSLQSCPSLTDSKRMLSLQDLGVSASIHATNNKCGDQVEISGTFQERQTALAHNGSAAGLEIGDAPVQNGASMNSVETTATFNSTFGVKECCATRSSEGVYSLGQSCEASGAFKVCIYKATY